MALVAVVTGANKGIGYEIVKCLCSRIEVVVLTSRNAEHERGGLEAVAALNDENLFPKYHVLDILDEKSIFKLRDYMSSNFGGLDILVNNAGIAYDATSTDPFAVQAKRTLMTNYQGTKMVCDILFPILRPGARVVNVSSSMGWFGHLTTETEFTAPGDKIRAQQLIDQMSSPELTEARLAELMEDFVDSAARGAHLQQGWPGGWMAPYAVSKMGLCALTRLQQRRLSTDPREDIVVNSVHTGSVTENLGQWTTEEQPSQAALARCARSSVYAALLPKGTNIRGEFLWHDNTVIDLVKGPLPSFM